MTCGNNHTSRLNVLLQRKKFASVLQRHLGIKEHHASTFKIAPHHFQLSLLIHRQQFKRMQWMKPLTREEAIRFGNSIAKIDLHPKSKKAGSKFYFQTPNVPKTELLFLLRQFNDDNDQQLQRKIHGALPTPASDYCDDNTLMSDVYCEPSLEATTSLEFNDSAGTDSFHEAKIETISDFKDENSLKLAACCESTEEHCLKANTSLYNNKSEQGQQNKFAIDIEGTDSWHEDNSETKLLYKHEGTFSEVTYPNDTV